MIILENAESQKRMYEKKCEDMASRLREMEKNLNQAQREVSNYQVIHNISNFATVLIYLLCVSFIAPVVVKCTSR